MMYTKENGYNYKVTFIKNVLGVKLLDVVHFCHKKGAEEWIKIMSDHKLYSNFTINENES